ncbi:hypothetical protein J6Q66_05635, partial [bacterium]|nr:hypothetical protein [bacterium]
NAYIVTKTNGDIPLMQTKANGSYIVDFDSQTEVIFGVDALKYLKRTNDFEFDTQVILPKKCEGTFLKDDKKVSLKENSAVLLQANTKAKIDINRGYPMIIMSKKDYDWYERYGKNAQTQSIMDKYEELAYYNSHSYNAHFSPNVFLPKKFDSQTFLKTIGIDKYQSKNNLLNDLEKSFDLLSDEDKVLFLKSKSLINKLFETNLVSEKEDGYIAFDRLFKTDYQKEILKQKGFNEEEIEVIMPIFSQVKKMHSDSRICRYGSALDYTQQELSHLKECGILHNNKKQLDKIFWKESFPDEKSLREKLVVEGFSLQEQENIILNWKKDNNVGYDVTGLKYIDEDVAIYNLNDKVNNWTLGETNWVTNSTAMSNCSGTTPFVGPSIVQTDKQDVVSMAQLRRGEKLHKHPNREEKKQTELYMITSGMAALIFLQDGKPEVKILKEGELAVIDGGVEHCVSSVLGEYEQIVVQVPSVFQYGFDFKQEVPLPEGYDVQDLNALASEKLLKEAK